MSDPSEGGAESGDATAAPGVEHPREIGPYRILRVLGEGGIGLVYLADQSEPVRRRVALKVIKLGMDTRQVVARFESERQALAVMDHPYIARVLDAGTAENGRPYFVMEHVQGVPITDYCDTQRLSTDERVRLFLDVCAAIQHAHQKGVVHRDLKPSNLLVGVQEGNPLVKVIDFGIAKAMGQGLTERTLVTRVGQLLGTPAYMSPEQAEMSGVDIDTRTDIYSLGVVLYELLAGALPIDLDSVPDYALPHALRNTDVPTASARLTTLGDASDVIARHRRTDVKRLRRELSGDLDWIIAKAMEKDRTRRYETVEAFAADLRRHLDHLPVLARPRSTGYVFTRFLRRHKAGVAAGTIALLALAAGAVLATVGFLRATRAEHDAEQQAQTAQRTAQFMIDLFEVSDPSEARGNSVTAREILDRGADRIRTQLTDQPDVQSNLMTTIGTVYGRLALYADAQSLLEEALAIRRKAFGANDLTATASLIALGELHYEKREIDEAEAAFREALAIRESQTGSGSVATAEARSDLGMVLDSVVRRRGADAEALYRQALATYERELGPDALETRMVRTNLASSLYRQRKLEDAESLLRAQLRSAPANDPLTADNTKLLAAVVGSLGRLGESEELSRSALAIYEHTYGHMHPHVATALHDLAVTLVAQGRYAAALPLLRDAIEICTTMQPDGNTDLALVQEDLGLALYLAQQPTEAEAQLRASIAGFTQVLGPDNASVGAAEARLADILVATSRSQEALTVAARAIPKLDRSPMTRVYATSAQAAALAALGKHSDAGALVPTLVPQGPRPGVQGRIAATRALALYARWAPDADVQRLRADLTAAGWTPLEMP